MTLRIEITLDGLRQVRERINQQRLETSDFAIFGAFVSNKIALEEAKQDRLLARIAADRAAAIAAAAAKAGAEKSENNFEDGTGEIVDADFNGTKEVCKNYLDRFYLIGLII